MEPLEPAHEPAHEPAPALDVSILVRDETWHDDHVDPDIETVCRKASLAAYQATRTSDTISNQVEASIVLADDNFVAELNARYRNREGPTNVLSFASLDGEEGEEAEDGDIGDDNDMPILLGDVIIARGVVAREAAEMGIPVLDHLQHLVVHGILHLLGYDHIHEADATEMESLETLILSQMGIDDPYTDDAVDRTG